MSAGTKIKVKVKVGAVVVAVLLVGACDESLYAPAPEVVPCGAEEQPCRLTCELDCAATVVDMAAGCMQSMQGTLGSARTRCDFPDGTRASFAWPIPAAGTDLSARSWKLELRGGSGSDCLSVTAEPLPWIAGGLRSRTEVQTGQVRYLQELTMRASSSPPADDGGAAQPDLERLTVRCPDGRFFEGRGREACGGCEEADCTKLPLVELRASWGGPTLDFDLRVGERVTPLFSCR
jgi:hypothetical protein